MTIKEAYEKYKNHDAQFTQWLGDDCLYPQKTIADLWAAIKEELKVEVEIICAGCGSAISADNKAHKGNLWKVNYHRGCRPIHNEKMEVEK